MCCDCSMFSKVNSFLNCVYFVVEDDVLYEVFSIGKDCVNYLVIVLVENVFE